MRASYICPECQACSLTTSLSIELPPDRDWDEITLQTFTCSQCGFTGLAAYTESRRGALDSEIWRHTGYSMDNSEVKKVSDAIQRCPNPRKSRCTCSSHKKLGRKDAQHRWAFFDTLRSGQGFELELCKR